MTDPPLRSLRLWAAIAGLGLSGPALQAPPPPNPEPQPNTPIEHVIVLMQENHSFDNYFGTYPGADGIPPGTCIPVDPFTPWNPACVAPFHLGDNEVQLADPDHSSDTFLRQYNRGRMDGFVHALRRKNQDGRLAMAYYDDRDLPFYWNLADEYVLFDRFFSSAAGGSFTNHIYWVAAVPGMDRSKLPPEGLGDLPTIFDRLDERGISWKFYVQNYDPRITYRTRGVLKGPKAAQAVWVPLLNYARYIDDPELSSRIVDLQEFFRDLQDGTLPAVAYMVPSGPSEHPPSSVMSGQRFVRTLLNELTRSSAWNSSAFILTYDDWGGWYDHVSPPQVDASGYGFRVPALLVSPYARRGHVDSTELDYTSILKFIEQNWDLEPLAERDANANSLDTAFDFSQPPREPRMIPWERPAKGPKVEPRRDVIYTAYGAALVVPALLIGWAAFDSDRRQRLALGTQAGLSSDGDS